MIDWSRIEAFTPEELAGLDFAQLSEDPLVLRIMTLLARAHLSDLVYGGNPSVVDPSGWAKSTLPAVAVLIAREVATPDTALRAAAQSVVDAWDDPETHFNTDPGVIEAIRAALDATGDGSRE